MAKLIVCSLGSGIGIELGDLGDGTHLAGLDLDSCLSGDGALAPWAQSILDVAPSYTEISPSGTGVKVFFLAACADIRPTLEHFGLAPDQWGCRRDVPARSPPIMARRSRRTSLGASSRSPSGIGRHRPPR